MNKKTLTLHISEPWYSMIASGKKSEEYREIKAYWIKRLLRDFLGNNLKGTKIYEKNVPALKTLALEGYILVKPFTHVVFIRGYPKGNIPQIEKEIVSIAIGKPKPGLCPKDFEDKDFFIIKFK